MGASKLSRSSVLIVTYSYSKESFFSSHPLFFVSWYYFEIDRIFFFEEFVWFFGNILFARVTGKIIHMALNNVSPWLKQTLKYFFVIFQWY